VTSFEPRMQLCTECPACDNERIDNTIDPVDGVCHDCGFVIQEGVDQAAVDWQTCIEGDEDSRTEDWLTECSVRNASEQQIACAFNTLEETANRLDVGIDVRHEAADIYCDAFRAKTTDGRETACMVAACLRIASYEVNEPIPAGRLTESPAIDRKKFFLSQSALENDLEHPLPTSEPSDYLPFLGTALDLNKRELRSAEDELETVVDEPAFVGKDPAAIAAAGVYVTLNEHTQSDVAAAAGVSTETIRQRVNQLRELTIDD